jgi:transcriptional accessory protein Tex/SPT6
LSAVAEDTNFSNTRAAESIAERIKTYGTQYSEETRVLNARDLLAQLEEEAKNGRLISSSMIDDTSYEKLTDFSAAKHALNAKERSDPWVTAGLRYRRDGIFPALIVNSNQHGIFAELEVGITGLVHNSRLPKDFGSLVELSIGERIRVKVLQVDGQKQRMRLLLVATGHDID